MLLSGFYVRFVGRLVKFSIFNFVSGFGCCFVNTNFECSCVKLTTRRLVSSLHRASLQEVVPQTGGRTTSVFVPPTLVLLFSSPKLAWKENDLLIRLLWLVSPATLRSLANCVRINPKQSLVPGECCWFLPTKLFTTRRHKRWLSKTSKNLQKLATIIRPFSRVSQQRWFISTVQKIQAELKVLFVVPDLVYQRIRPKSELKVCECARVWGRCGRSGVYGGFQAGDVVIDRSSPIVSSSSSGVFEERPCLLTHSRDFHSYWSGFAASEWLRGATLWLKEEEWWVWGGGG